MITVITVNYNSGSQLTACVASLLASTVPVKVIVSDNDSRDDSLARLEAFFGHDERITVIRNHANLGFSAGCNIGLAHATGDYVLFINPDCVVPPHALERMCGLMEAQPEVGMAGCMIRNPDGSEQAGCRRYTPTPWRALMRVLRLNLLFPNQAWFQTFNMQGTPLPNAPVQVEAISGAFMFVRRQALERVGPLDEAYFLHCEDLDWCMRFNRSGYVIQFVPDVEIRHLKGGSQASQLFVEWHKHKGMTRFYRKFFRERYSWMMLWLVIFAVHVRFALLASVLWAQSLWKRPRLPEQRRVWGGDATLLRDAGGALCRRTVMVVGATSQVGRFLLPRLVQGGYRVIALSRHGAPEWADREMQDVLWLKADIHDPGDLDALPAAHVLIHLAPLMILPTLLSSFAALGIQRLVAFSSSSKYSKASSPVEAERVFASRLEAAEQAVAQAGRELHVRWTIFRPTLIYGCDMDRNVTLIRRVVQKMGFFPLLGAASGLRQPVHADDLAAACVAVLETPTAFDKGYELSGGECLSYRDMVARIFASLHRSAHFLRIPIPLFAIALRVVALIPRYRDFNVAMAQRMNENLVYSHEAAARDFDYRPRPFNP